MRYSRRGRRVKLEKSVIIGKYGIGRLDFSAGDRSVEQCLSSDSGGETKTNRVAAMSTNNALLGTV